MLMLENVKIRSEKIKITKLSHTGQFQSDTMFAFIDPADYIRARSQLAVPEAIIRAAVIKHRASGEDVTKYEMDDQRKVVQYKVRLLKQPTTPDAVFDTFQEAWDAASKLPATLDQDIRWDGVDQTCSLDVDFKGEGVKPSGKEVERFVSTLNPAPIGLFISKGGHGVHAIYQSADIYDADELAAVAGYFIKRRYPTCTLEFLHRTRTARVSLAAQQETDTQRLNALMSDVTVTDPTEWLEERGYVVGGKYTHDQCPVNPSDRAKTNSPPVVVHDDHIYCYICAADGKCSGGKTPGWFGFAALQNARIGSQISLCVDNLVHWSHAKHVLRGQITDIALARKVYSVLLKVRYGEDSRVKAVFVAGEPNGLVRYQGYWADNDGSIVKVSPISNILASLPHCQGSKQNGGVDIDKAAVEWMSQPLNLACRGYSAVTPLFGVQLSQWQELPPDKIFNVLQIPDLANNHVRQPVFIPQASRMDIDEAWSVLDTIVPGVTRELVELLIVARGCTEHRAGLPPMVFITGGTSTGKTSHVEIAAAIVGDSMNKVYINPDRDRMNNQVLTAKRAGSYVNFDEFFKGVKNARMTDVEAMETLLGYTEESLLYVIHVGSVPLGNMPVFVWTDTKINADVQMHEQIGRRVHHYRLPNQVQWVDSMAAAGIGAAKYLRTRGSLNVVAACNSILSDIMERFFSCPVTNFQDVARELGIKLIQESDAMSDRDMLVNELFDAVCLAPTITDPIVKKRFSPRGLKVARKMDTDAIYTAFLACQDEKERGSMKCRMMEEAGIKKACKLKHACEFEIKQHGATLAFRFVSTDGKLVNEELR